MMRFSAFGGVLFTYKLVNIMALGVVAAGGWYVLYIFARGVPANVGYHLFDRSTKQNRRNNDCFETKRSPQVAISRKQDKLAIKILLQFWSCGCGRFKWMLGVLCV